MWRPAAMSIATSASPQMLMRDILYAQFVQKPLRATPDGAMIKTTSDEGSMP